MSFLVIHTRFPLNPKYQALDVNATHLYGQHVLATLLKALYPEEMILLAIDDAHLLDVIIRVTYCYQEAKGLKEN
jgi:hypothetical protein